MTESNQTRSDNVVWLQLTAGQGPKECAWVVAKLSQAILQAAEVHNINAERVEGLAYDKLQRCQSIIEPDAFLSVLLRLQGKLAITFAKQWEGSIKWQGESPYRPKHKRINWFVGVALVSMPEQKPVDIKQLEKDIAVDMMKATGPGGQHVNKTNSAVRITHLPTGLQIKVDSDRSQHRNKQIALERLQLLLAHQLDEEKENIERIRWLKHYDVKRGQPVRIFYGKEFIERA